MTQFKDALQSLEDFGEPTTPEHDKAIRLALRIADKVMQEPSEAMCEKCDDLQIADKYGNWKYAPPEYIFRAMIEQMMREIGDE